jgi:CTP synthase (UTP-ammonia lyase)
MSHWQEIIRKLIAPQHRVRIGVVGKYIELHDAYKSVYEAIIHGGVANDCGVEIVQVDAEEIEKFGAEKILKGWAASWCRAALANAASRAKSAAKFARENKIPYLGLCLGMQIATIEFARNVLKLNKAHSTEFDPKTPHPGHRHAGRAKAGHQKRRHHAPGRAALPVGGRLQGRPAPLRLVRHPRAPPPPLRIQQRLPRKI